MKLEQLVRAAQSRESAAAPPRGSPPPEPARLARLVRSLRPKKKRPYKFAHVLPRVDTAPPALALGPLSAPLRRGVLLAHRLLLENMRMVRLIWKHQFTRGLVDSRWRREPADVPQYHQARVDFSKRVCVENRRLYKLFTTVRPRLPTTAELERGWAAAVARRRRGARGPWLLAAPAPRPDPAFDAPPGVHRPRVVLRLRMRGGAALGALRVELFAEACPRTVAKFLTLLRARPGYVGTCFYRRSMLLADAGPGLAGSELLIKVISPEGQAFSAFFPEDTLIEEVKNRASDYFYPAGEAGVARYKLVRVSGAGALHDFLTLAQVQLESQEELLLVERHVPEAGALWDLSAVRAPAPAAVAAATAALPAPRAAPRQPNLQALLSTNELSYELRKILISLVEAGARLAAAGPNYEHALAQLSAALEEPRRATRPVVEVITPEEIALRMSSAEQGVASAAVTSAAPAVPPASDAYRRAEHLQRFLEQFRAWRVSRGEPPSPEALGTLRELGFPEEEAERALRRTGCNVPAAASWLVGERSASVYELVEGLPDGLILQTLLKQPQIQRGLLNTRMLAAFVAMVGQTGSAALWLNSPHGSPLLGQISRTYHAEKYCLAVNQFSEQRDHAAPSTSHQR